MIIYCWKGGKTWEGEINQSRSFLYALSQSFSPDFNNVHILAIYSTEYTQIDQFHTFGTFPHNCFNNA